MHTLRQKDSCTRACAPMQWCRIFFAMETIANLSWVLCEHRAGCHLPSALLLSRRNQSPDTVRSRNLSKSTLAHDAVAAIVLHNHHLIIRVGAGLIQFVYGSHSRLAADLTLENNYFRCHFRGLLLDRCCEHQHTHLLHALYRMCICDRCRYIYIYVCA